MKTKNLVSIVLCVLILSSCNLPASMTEASSGTLVIIAPLDGTHLSVGQTVDIQSQVGASNITSAALVVNESIYRQDDLDTPLGSGSLYQPWTPTETGIYIISVLVSSADGELASAKITIIVDEADAATQPSPTTFVPTETLSPDVTATATSILPSATFTSTAIGASTAINSPPTATNTSVPTATATTIPSTATNTLTPPTATATAAIVIVADSTISGKIFRDENGSGSLNPADTPIAGVTVLLGSGACPSSGLRSTQTAGDGSYIFSSLPAGQYCVTADAGSLPSIGGTWQASLANPHSLSLGVSDGQTRNFMFQPIIK